MRRKDLKENEKNIIILRNNKNSKMIHNFKQVFIDEIKFLKKYLEERKACCDPVV